MPIPLSLSAPTPRDRPPLTAGLLHPRTSSVDPNEMLGAGVAAASEFRDTDADGVIIALEVDSQPPLAIFMDPMSADVARAIVDAGHIPGIDLAAPVDAVADFLAVLAHSHVGFVARATSGAQVVAILAGTVAALRGDDVRSALRSPDPAKLLSLNPDAVAAVREVLLGVEIDDPDEAIAYLRGIGLSSA